MVVFERSELPLRLLMGPGLVLLCAFSLEHSFSSEQKISKSLKL